MFNDIFRITMDDIPFFFGLNVNKFQIKNCYLTFWCLRIHGGGFSLGQAVEYVPTRYMEKDMVVVVIQYRLGPLGK